MPLNEYKRTIPPFAKSFGSLLALIATQGRQAQPTVSLLDLLSQEHADLKCAAAKLA